MPQPGLSYRDVLCYFYMRGMFAIAAEQWDVAKDQLEIVSMTARRGIHCR